MNGKRVVITGGSSGIGEALGRSLVEAGAEVISFSRRAPAVNGVRHLSVDLRKPKEIQAAILEVGTLDVLINNAGMAYSSSIMHGDLAEWEEMWEVNVRALAYACQLALPCFPESGGQIVNVSSMSGHRVPPSGGFYAPTKFAVRGVSEALRLELRAAGNPTRVSSISPGFVDTPLLGTYFQGREEALAKTKEAMMMLSAEDIATQIRQILETPLHVEIGDVSLRSVSQTV